MGWLETGMGWLKTAKTFVDPIKQFVSKTGEYTKYRTTEKDPITGQYPVDTGFMSKAAGKKFGLPHVDQPDPHSLIFGRIGASKQYLTNIERIMEPVHNLQANGYDSLANALIRKAIEDSNLVSVRDLLPTKSVATTESQNIKLGKTSVG